MNLHQQIEHYIYEKINSGELKTGDQIPTESELAELFSASRPTVRQALMHLSSRGYLTRIKGKGSFVTQPKVLHESTSFISGYRHEISRHNQTLISKVVKQKIVRADEKVAQKLQVSAGSKVILLTRVRTLEGFNNNQPVLYTSVYIPYKKLPEMLDVDFTNYSLYDLLSESGLEIRHASKCLEVCIPPLEVATELSISRFEPTIFVTSTGITENNTIVEYSETYYPAGCSQFLIEINK